MKVLFNIFLVFFTVIGYSQVDTLEFYYYYSDYQYTINICKDPKKGTFVKEYIYSEGPKKGEKVEKSKVKLIEKSTHNPDVDKCSPCWQKVSNQNGIYYEGLFYTDCCVGQYIEYHPNGVISIKGQYPNMIVNELPDDACRKTGEWYTYDEKGELLTTETYENGIKK